ncbi:MAG: hypothetical protein CMO79_04230 [Verrucomicrobiales bacterium]|nr:hypothetical protein [Verrucomicrobiales bacterium]
MSIYCIIIGLIPLIYSICIFGGRFKRERSKNKKGALWRTIKFIFTDVGPKGPGSNSSGFPGPDI